MRYLCVLAFSVLVGGCTTALPPKAIVSDDYSLLGVESYSLTLSGEGVDLDPSLGAEFLANYLLALEGNLRVAMCSRAPEYRYAARDDADLSIDVSLETLQGGSAAARFWIGYGAGQTVSTVYVRIRRDGRLVAEGRVTETTSLVDIWSGNYANDQAIMQDCPRLAQAVVEFVSGPRAATPRTNAQETGRAPSSVMMRRD